MNTHCRDCGAPFERPLPFAKYCNDCRWRHRGKHRKYVWTAERDAYLRVHYSSSKRRVAERMAELWGWPVHAIRMRAAKLGLTTSRTELGQRFWTAEETAFLEAKAGRRDVYWLARQLRRTPNSVAVKLKRMGISTSVDGYTCRAVAVGFGVDPSTVTRWVTKGWLVASRNSELHGSEFRITDRALQQFIRIHRHAYDLRKVDQVWWLDVVLGAAKVQENAA